MIIGDGLVATAMKRIDSDDVIIFASGVSNSREKKIGEFLREEKLLMNVLCDKLIIYLYSVHQENSPYGIHKRRMEEIIRTTKNYLILRVSQLTIKRWGKRGKLPAIIINSRGDRRYKKEAVLWLLGMQES